MQVVSLYAAVEYNLDHESHLRGIMGCFSALGTVAFAYGGHNVVLEIQVRELPAELLPSAIIQLLVCH